MAELDLKRSFAPVIAPNVRLLVLGSLPGEMSLAATRYYANPRNQFWLLIGAAIGRDLVSLDYDERLRALLGAGVGLWDTVGSGRRAGSHDGNIRLDQANDLAALAAQLPELRAVAFNGGKSASIGRRQLAGAPHLTLVDLPSSSPAYTLALERKREAWGVLRTFL
jgi:hypoxanthine-DNA glycosylase